MAAKDTKLLVFAHLGTAWAPCGQLVLTEEADRQAGVAALDPVCGVARQACTECGIGLLDATGEA